MKGKRMRRLPHRRVVGAFWSLLHSFGHEGRAKMRVEFERQITTRLAVPEGERTPQHRKVIQEAGDILSCLEMFEADFARDEEGLAKAIGRPMAEALRRRRVVVEGKGTAKYDPPPGDDDV
jgi:hypothetical protein